MAEPRSLTEDEINHIVSLLPDPPGVGKTAIELAKNELKRRVRISLQDIKLVPDAIPELTEEIIEGIRRAFIPYRSPVGTLGATSATAPLTQSTMNTHKTAGADSGITNTFSKVRNLITGSKQDKYSWMRVFFMTEDSPATSVNTIYHRGTEEEIYAMRPFMEETTVERLVQDVPEILDNEQVINEGVPQMLQLHRAIYPNRFAPDQIIDNELSSVYDMNNVMKLSLDTYRMYSHKITMDDVARAIMGPHDDEHYIACVWKSQSDGYMYILVNKIRNLGKKVLKPEEAVPLYLREGVIVRFPNTTVKGIPGIISIEPQIIRVSDIINQVVPYPSDPTQQIIIVSGLDTRFVGASLYDLYRLLILAGFEVTSIDEDNLFISVRYQGDLLNELNNRVMQAENTSKEQRTEQQKQLVNAYQFFYMYTYGSNYDEILWMPNVDLFRSHPSNAHYISDLLGINAGRLFLLLEFMRTIDKVASGFDPRHVELIFFMLTNRGAINNVGSAGPTRRKVGPMSASTYTQAMRVFLTASTFGEKEPVRGISTSIAVGKPTQQLGSTAVKVIKRYGDYPEQPPPEVGSFEEITIPDINTLFLRGFASLRFKMPEKPVIYNAIESKTTTTKINNTAPVPTIPDPLLTIKPNNMSWDDIQNM